MGQLVVVGSALVLLEGLLSDQEGQEFALADLDRWEVLYRIAVPPGLGLGIILNGQIKLVPHERQVPHDGLGRDLQFPRKL